MPFIASTMSANVDYVDYYPSDSGAHTRKRTVTIKGGAGVASRPHALATGMLTPPGHVTEVTDEELDFLMNNHTFKQQMNAGFLQVLKRDVAPEKATKDMKTTDPSAPLTEKDFKEGGRSKMAADMAVKTGKIT